MVSIADVAGDDFFDLELAGAEGELARILVEVAFEDVGDDVAPDADGSRRRGAPRRRCRRLGDVPGEAAVVADAGDQGDLPLRSIGIMMSLSRSRLQRMQSVCEHERNGLPKAENSGKRSRPILAFCRAVG